MAGERTTGAYHRLEALTEALESANKTLDRLARTDPLTELGNRLRLSEDLEKLHASAVRHDRSYAVALIDIDHFKAYNDRFGHPAGDEALHAVASILTRGARSSDHAYRYGGEEMVIVMPETSLGQARQAGERLRAAVEAHEITPVAHARDEPERLTVSVGVASIDPGPFEGPDAVVQAADEALYRAKEGGRNRVSD